MAGNQTSIEMSDHELRRLKPQMSVSPGDRVHWGKVFQEMDTNGDGKISYKELKNKLKQYNKNLPKNVARQQLKKNDTNDDGYLDLEEFMEMLESQESRALFYNMMEKYVNYVIPRRKRAQDEPDAEYEDQYTCCPPPLCMVLFSILEIIAFVYDSAMKSDSYFSEPVAVLIYNPHRRVEAWRFLTYMFVHNGVFHLIVNLLVQIMLGIPLEMVHHWWRIALIYIAGVVAGSLGTSISDPKVYLAGASGGVYAIMTAHVATIILNWKEMQFAIAQLFIFLVIACTDVGSAIYNRYIIHSEESQTIGYAAHLAGALAGLLVGINVLRNLDVARWEKILWWVSLITYVALMLAAIIWNVAYPSYFPSQYV